MAIPYYDNIDLNNNKIANSKDPEQDKDVVNKIYLDRKIEAINTSVDTKIESKSSELTEYIDGKISTINTNITDLDNDIINRIHENISDDLFTNDALKSLSASKGVELRTRIESIITSLESVNDYTSIEDGELPISGNILGISYTRCVIPIYIDTEIGTNIVEHSLVNKISNISVIFKISGYLIANKKVYYINTDNIKLIDYDINNNILKLQYSDELLPTLRGNTVYVIIEYYEDNNFLPEEVTNSEKGE